MPNIHFTLLLLGLPEGQDKKLLHFLDFERISQCELYSANQTHTCEAREPRCEAETARLAVSPFFWSKDGFFSRTRGVLVASLHLWTRRAGPWTPVPLGPI